MKVIKKKPAMKLEIIEIENELKALQDAVGGNIQAVPFVNDIIILCDEEGKLKRQMPNFPYKGDLIVGDVLFVGTVLGEFRGLNDTEIGLVQTIFEMGGKSNVF